MKLILILSILILCIENQAKAFQYSSLSDTLIIKSQKEKGYGLFIDFASGHDINFVDTSEILHNHLKYPVNISNIKVGYEIVDFKYYNSKKYKAGNIDPFNIPSEKDNSIFIMKGIKDRQHIYIIDANSNCDFRDDSILQYNKNAFETITKVKYKIFNGLKLIEDSSWCATPSFDGNELTFFITHHLSSEFCIDKDRFKIGAIAKNNSGFTFDKPVISLISENDSSKDKLLTEDIIDKGEYIKLGKDFYQFADISNDGKYITLIREYHFDKKIGIQKGMITPSFKVESTNGTIFNNNNLKNRLFLLANVSACNSDSHEAYNNLYEAKKESFTLIGIEYGVEAAERLKGIVIVSNDNINNDFYLKYRKEPSDYTCYLIDTSGRIIEKFRIFEWESVLKKY